jgi:2-dehydropantoate 2-reductase
MISVVNAQKPQHVIFGAGLIGCYLGGVFSSLGLNTLLVCRETVKTKLQAGMTLTDYLDHKQVVSELSFMPEDSSSLKPDFLWLTVKCTGVESALKDMQALVHPQTVILCCQNGLGSEESVKQAFPNNHVLRVMVPFNVVEVSAGHFHRGSEGTLAIEQTSETQRLITDLVATIHCDLLAVTTSSDMQALLWAKLQLNLSNSVCALADIPVKPMLEQRSYRQIIALLMQELLQVTSTQKIKLPKLTALPAAYIPFVLRSPNVIFNLIANKMLAIDPKVKTSMWWDISAGKKTEINYLNGAVVERGKQLGIACPANQKIVDLIKSLETCNSKGKPSPISGDELLNFLQVD